MHLEAYLGRHMELLEMPNPAVADGDLLLCGSNENSQLGWDPLKAPSHVQQCLQSIDGVPALTLPSRVASLDAFAVHHIGMGISHTVALVADGTLATWGANEFGQLGESFKFEISSFETNMSWSLKVALQVYNISTAYMEDAASSKA